MALKISNNDSMSVDTLIPLAKYLAHAGVCSRRRAESLIKSGLVLVNGVVESQPHRRVMVTDRIVCDGVLVRKVSAQKSLHYYILNKPAGVLCTAHDPEGRATIFDFMPRELRIRDRMYNVGRLDCNSTGLILLTNDGELTHQLTHPKYAVEKTYHVQLHRPLTDADALRIRKGVRLDDGICSVRDLAVIGRDDARHVQLVLSSGKNRIIRRLFEALGYFVKRLERVKFGHISKKGLALGAWRRLATHEVARFKR